MKSWFLTKGRILLGRVVQLWRDTLATTNAKAAQSLADPTEYENLFPGLKEAFKTEQYLKTVRGQPTPASKFPKIPVSFCDWSCCISSICSRLLDSPPSYYTAQDVTVSHWKHTWLVLQQISERNPTAEMQAAEASGQFAMSSPGEESDSEVGAASTAMQKTLAEEEGTMTPPSTPVTEVVRCLNM